jgi:AcrR family transcriptional regulator
MSTTLTRQARKAETRRALIQAAAELFAHKGLDATSMDEIGSAVGLTKGAVYAHFSSKTELVDEVLDAAGASVAGEQLIDPEYSLSEGFVDLGREAARILPNVQRETLMLYLEYLLYVMRDPSRRRKYVKERREQSAEGGRSVDDATRARGDAIGVSGQDLVMLLDALGQGLVIALLLDREGFNRDALVRFFAALGYGLENTEAVNALLSKRSST